MTSNNINLSLQDYLSKSSGSSNSLANLSGSFKSSLSDLKKSSRLDRIYSWVGANSTNDLNSNYDSSSDGDEAVNGWFAQASKDPCLPSMVIYAN